MTDAHTIPDQATLSATTLRFDAGTLILRGVAPATAARLGSTVVFDSRTLEWRAPANAYRDLVLTLRGLGTQVDDQARQFSPLSLALKQPITPRTHQAEALAAWVQGGRAGCVSLPTGAGKTILAVLAILKTQRPTLVMVPTLDLMQQWQVVLERFFGPGIGLLGGGSHELGALTVATYDSALIHIERLGSRFGMLVFDECHHLPAPQYQAIALGSLAPYRLGLSATMERADGRESVIYDLVGPLVYKGHIHDMPTAVLSPYDVVNIQVPMTETERAAYQAARQVYTDFLRRTGIRFGEGADWMQFVRVASRSAAGRQALKSYREQKRLAQAAEGKLDQLWQILCMHKDERILVFTDDNALAYRIGRELFLPVITHQTKLKERKAMLDAFRAGTMGVLATAKVLNEGVDVPEASIGVVLSGSGAVREHVQRLGRILRARPEKRAVLYELIAKGTSEYFVNQRRRQHDAYQGPPPLPNPKW